MAGDIQHFTATIPAGTPANAPVTIAVATPVRIVRRVDWKTLPGHMGTMSFLLAMSGVPVLPVAGVFTYVTADGKDGFWEIEGYPDSGAWQVIGFNTGAFPHSVLLTFHTDLPERPAPPPAALPLWMLSASPDLSHAGPPLPGEM